LTSIITPWWSLTFVVHSRHQWNWRMHQSEGTDSQRLLFIDRFVQWPSPRDDYWLLLCIPDIDGIEVLEGCVNLKDLDLRGCSSLTGLFSGHHPMMITDFNCASQTSKELKGASSWRFWSSVTALRWPVCYVANTPWW
jgi:hypothetical protein